MRVLTCSDDFMSPTGDQRRDRAGYAEPQRAPTRTMTDHAGLLIGHIARGQQR